MAFTGKWKLDRSENIDKMAQQIGGPMMSKMAKVNDITNVVKQDGDNFHLKMITPQATHEFNITIGKEWEELIRPYNGTYKCRASWDDKALVVKLEPQDSKNHVITERREIVDGEFVLTTTVNGVEGKRFFKKQ